MGNIGIILTSSVFAAVLTSLVNWYIQRNNFRNDYFKKVIEYRVKAYEQVAGLLLMFPFVHDIDEAERRYEYDDLGLCNYKKIVGLLKTLVQDGYWLSNEMKLLIEAYYKNVDEFYDPYNGSPNEEVEKMAAYSKETEVFKEQVINVFYKDMASLHKVKYFFKEKKI